MRKAASPVARERRQRKMYTPIIHGEKGKNNGDLYGLWG